MIIQIIKDKTIEGANKWSYIFNTTEAREAWEADQFDQLFRTKTEAREYMEGMEFDGIEWRYNPG